MKTRIKNWILKDAKWWEFWQPQSGPLGGLSLVALLLAFVHGCHWLLW